MWYCRWLLFCFLVWKVVSFTAWVIMFHSWTTKEQKLDHTGSRKYKFRVSVYTSTIVMFIRPCIVIYFYSETNQMHQCLKFIYFWNNPTCFRHMPVAVCTVVNSWWCTERPSKTRRVIPKINKFETLVHLVGFTIETHNCVRDFSHHSTFLLKNHQWTLFVVWIQHVWWCYLIYWLVGYLKYTPSSQTFQNQWKNRKVTAWHVLI